MEIVRDRFGDTPGDEPSVVLGDLNDYLVTDAAGKTGIDQLVEWDRRAIAISSASTTSSAPRSGRIDQPAIRRE